MNDPYRDAVYSLLPDDLKEELEKAEAKYSQNLAEAEAAKGRAAEAIRLRKDKPLEALEFELEKESEELLKYHTRKFVKGIRWILQAYKDTPED